MTTGRTLRRDGAGSLMRSPMIVGAMWHRPKATSTAWLLEARAGCCRACEPA